MPYYSRDDRATDALYANKVFQDRRSYVSNPDTRGFVHVVLEGKDRSRQRDVVFELSKGKCAVCKEECPKHQGEMHHPGHCDCVNRKCPDRLEWRHSPYLSGRLCHQHRIPGFRRHAK